VFPGPNELKTTVEVVAEAGTTRLLSNARTQEGRRTALIKDELESASCLCQDLRVTLEWLYIAQDNLEAADGVVESTYRAVSIQLTDLLLTAIVVSCL